MLEAVRNAFRLPDLRRKLLFTLGILVLYRLMSHIPVPGVNVEALNAMFSSNQLLGLLNLLSGGALENFSVMAMGVYPYITASIIVQLLIPIIPAWQEMQKEGEAGRNRLNQYTNWLTIPLALLQAFGQSSLLAQGSGSTGPVLTEFGFRDYPLQTTVILMSLTAGTMLAMWLGQLITQQGIGNGISIIIFGGIIAGMPQNVVNTYVQGGFLQLLVFILVTVFTVAVIVVVQEGQRRIPVQYGKRVRAMRGNRLMVVGGQSTHVPMRVNSAGMIPLIFASSMLIFPSTIASYFVNAENDFRKLGGELRLQLLHAGQWLVLDHVLPAGHCVYVFLYGRDLQAAEPARDVAAPGWFHSRYPARHQYGEVLEHCAFPHHAGRRAVPGLCGDSAVARQPDSSRSSVGQAPANRRPALC